MDSRVVGVILAAGRGSRLEPLSIYRPKALLPICNKPLLQYQLEDMREIGIRDVLVVVGHLKEGIVSKFGDGSAYGVRLRYIEQTQMLGIAHAIGQLEPFIDAPFLLFLGDIFFQTSRLGQTVELLRERTAGAVLAVRQEENPAAIRRNFAVVLHPSGRVAQVIEKPRFPPTNLKGCGLYVFDLPIFDAIRRTPRTAQRDEYEVTSSIQILIDDGYPVYPAEIVDMDVNLTIASDLLRSNILELKRLRRDHLVGQGVTLVQGTRLERSVLGEGVVVENPIRIVDSVVFPGVVINCKEDVVGQVVTSEVTIDCRGDLQGAGA